MSISKARTVSALEIFRGLELGKAGDDGLEKQPPSKVYVKSASNQNLGCSAQTALPDPPRRTWGLNRRTKLNCVEQPTSVRAAANACSPPPNTTTRRKSQVEKMAELAIPKKKGGSAPQARHEKYNILQINRESDDVVWGNAPVPPVPPSTSRRLSSTASTIMSQSCEGSTAEAVAATLHERLTLSEYMLRASKNTSAAPDPKPEWNHDFVDHESLALRDCGSINDEDAQNPCRVNGRRKSALNMTLARSLIRDNPAKRPANLSKANKQGDAANYRKTLTDFVINDKPREVTRSSAAPSSESSFIKKNKKKKGISLGEYLAKKKVVVQIAK